MTASPQMQALRFRIWQYAAPREWDVTTKEIAEALDEPWQRVRNALVDAGWNRRVRGLVSADPKNFGREAGYSRAVEGLVIRDILAGRVNSEFTA